MFYPKCYGSPVDRKSEQEFHRRIGTISKAFKTEINYFMNTKGVQSIRLRNTSRRLIGCKSLKNKTTKEYRVKGELCKYGPKELICWLLFKCTSLNS